MTAQKKLHDNHPPTFDGLDDAELVAQCRREIPRRLDAYRELVSRHEPEVFETCFRLVADKPAAEQICEDAFVQVFHQIDQFRPGPGNSNLRTWLFQIVSRLCELHFEGLSNPFDRGRVPAESPDPMAQALGILDREERVWIVLRFVGGLEIDEIAEVLEVTGSEAKDKLYRALCRFREASELIAS